MNFLEGFAVGFCIAAFWRLVYVGMRAFFDRQNRRR